MDKVILLCEVVEVVVDSLARDVTILCDFLIFIGRNEYSFEHDIANLCKEVGIDLFSRPYTPNGLAIVGDDEIGTPYLVRDADRSMH